MSDMDPRRAWDEHEVAGADKPRRPFDRGILDLCMNPVKTQRAGHT